MYSLLSIILQEIQLWKILLLIVFLKSLQKDWINRMQYIGHLMRTLYFNKNGIIATISHIIFYMILLLWNWMRTDQRMLNEMSSWRKSLLKRFGSWISTLGKRTYSCECICDQGKIKSR